MSITSLRSLTYTSLSTSFLAEVPRTTQYRSSLICVPVYQFVPSWPHGVTSRPPQKQIEQENGAGYDVGGSQCDVGEAVFGHGSVVEGGYKVSSSGYTNHFKLACHVRQTLGYEFNGLLQAIRINNQSWWVMTLSELMMVIIIAAPQVLRDCLGYGCSTR